jgi:biopolymer transport protein ExbD
MLEKAMPLSQSRLGSALAGTSMIRPKGNKGGRVLTAGLMLTSLVDAFSILVIFLIMNHSASQDVVNVGDKIQLPTAMESQFIQEGIVVRIEDGKFVVEETPVALSQLAATLKKMNASADTAKKEGLIIVADRNLDYADLSPVILAGSNAGFTKFKFAVIRKE